METDFTKNFRAGSRIVRAYEMIETDLGGAGVWDICPARAASLGLRLPAASPKAGTTDCRGTDGSRAAREPAVRAVSIADAVWAGSPNIERKRLLRRTATVSASVAAMRAHMPTFTAALHAEDPQTPGKYYYRIMLRSAERQSAAQKKQLIER